MCSGVMLVLLFCQADRVKLAVHEQAQRDPRVSGRASRTRV